MSFRNVYGYSRSENGWRMCNRDECDIVRIPDLFLTETAPLRKGAPLTILGAWLYWYDRNVEEILTSVWGWSATNDVANSNHLSGTAVDVNAPKYPWGARVMPAARKAKIREGLKLFEGTVFWGADWDRADEMHFQMAFPEGDARSERFAAKLRDGHLGIWKSAPAAPAAGLTADVLAQAMGCSVGRAREMLDPFVGAMRAAQITTPLRAAHWCAQIGHESAGLVYMEEIASGEAYNGRTDLGNIYPGDGPRFKGSGPIQLTGRHNFGLFSEWCFAKRYTTSPTYFVDHPDLVRTNPKWGFLAASWYWTVARPNLNRLADADDLVGVTKAINGGTTGLDDRRERLTRCKALGAKLLPPTAGGLTVDASTELTKHFPSRSIFRHSDALIDTLAGFVLNIDAREHERFVFEMADAGDATCIDLIKREAAKGEPRCKAWLKKAGM